MTALSSPSKRTQSITKLLNNSLKWKMNSKADESDSDISDYELENDCPIIKNHFPSFQSKF